MPDSARQLFRTVPDSMFTLFVLMNGEDAAGVGVGHGTWCARQILLIWPISRSGLMWCPCSTRAGPERYWKIIINIDKQEHDILNRFEMFWQLHSKGFTCFFPPCLHVTMITFGYVQIIQHSSLLSTASYIVIYLVPFFCRVCLYKFRSSQM